MRIVDFTDGFESETEPTAGVIPIGALKTFVDDAAFVTDKGSAAAQGDAYVNTTSDVLKVYQTAWTNIVDDSATQTVGGAKTFSNLIATAFQLESDILDSNGNEILAFTETASAVNEIDVANAATGNAPALSAQGDDTNVDFNINPKGTGKVALSGNNGLLLPSGTTAQRVNLAAVLRYNTDLTTFEAYNGSWNDLLSTPNLGVTSKVGAYTILTTDSVVTGDSSGGAFTLTLPTAVGITGKTFYLKKTDSSFNIITVDGDGSETIDGSTTKSLSTQNESITIVSDGANWQILNRSIPSILQTFSMAAVDGGGAISLADTPDANLSSLDRISERLMRVTWDYQHTTNTGAADNTSGAYRWTVPQSLSIDTSYYSVTTALLARATFGTAKAYNGSTTWDGSVKGYDSTHVVMSVQSDATSENYVGESGHARITNATIRYTFEMDIAILEWA